MEICDWCKTNAGRTHATRKCCVLRRLAQAPSHILKGYAETLSEDEKTALRADILEERKRLRRLK